MNFCRSLTVCCVERKVEPNLRSVGRKVAAFLFIVAILGGVSRCGDDEPDATVAPTPTASATVTSTVPPVPVPTVTVTASAPPPVTVKVLDPDCVRAAELSTQLIDAVFDYSEATSPTDTAINEALKGIASKDIQEINKSVEKLNEISEDSSDPVNRIVELQIQLKQVSERCHT